MVAILGGIGILLRLCMIFSCIELLCVHVYAIDVFEKHDDSLRIVKEKKEFFRLPSVERIEALRNYYRSKLTKNARIRTTVLLLGAGVAIATTVYVFSSFIGIQKEKEQKKAFFSARSIPEGFTLDEYYKHAYIEHFLQEEQERSFKGAINANLKKGVGYAVGTFTTAYILWIFSRIQSGVSQSYWRDVYSTEEDLFLDQADMLKLQTKYLKKATAEIIKQCTEFASEQNIFSDFIRFKDFFIADFVDAYEGFIVSIEHLMAFVLESSVLHKHEKDFLLKEIDIKIKKLMDDLILSKADFDLLFTSESHDFLVQQCMICFGQVNKMQSKVKTLMDFFATDIYGVSLTRSLYE